MALTAAFVGGAFSLFGAHQSSKAAKNQVEAQNEAKKIQHEYEKLDYLVAYEIRKSRVAFRYDNNSPCLTTKMGTGGNNVPYLVICVFT